MADLGARASGSHRPSRRGQGARGVDVRDPHRPPLEPQRDVEHAHVGHDLSSARTKWGQSTHLARREHHKPLLVLQSVNWPLAGS